jgi:hypothetical protein
MGAFVLLITGLMGISDLCGFIAGYRFGVQGFVFVYLHLFSFCIILSHIGLTYKTGFGLDDWIYNLHIHTVQDYWQYNTIAILHTFQFTVAHALEFSAFTSHILATDLSQSHCNFKSHMKSSLHHLIPFLALILRFRIPKSRLNSIPSSYPGRPAFWNPTLHTTRLFCFYYFYFIHPFFWLYPYTTARHGPHTKHSFSIVKEACLLGCCIAMGIYASQGCVYWVLA